MEFHVPDMTCGHCTAAVRKSVTAADPSADVTTNLESHVVTINTKASHSEMAAAIKAAGYEATRSEYFDQTQ